MRLGKIQPLASRSEDVPKACTKWSDDPESLVPEHRFSGRGDGVLVKQPTGSSCPQTAAGELRGSVDLHARVEARRLRLMPFGHIRL